MGVVIVIAFGLALCAVIGAAFMIGVDRLVAWVVTAVERRQAQDTNREKQDANRS